MANRSRGRDGCSLNQAFLARADGDRLAWDLEDAEFVEAAHNHLADWYATQGNSDNAPQSNTVLTQECPGR